MRVATQAPSKLQVLASLRQQYQTTHTKRGSLDRRSGGLLSQEAWYLKPPEDMRSRLPARTAYHITKAVAQGRPRLTLGQSARRCTAYTTSATAMHAACRHA